MSSSFNHIKSILSKKKGACILTDVSKEDLLVIIKESENRPSSNMELDVFTIPRSSSIEGVRTTLEEWFSAPMHLRSTYIIVEEADRLPKPSAVTLLKSLEDLNGRFAFLLSRNPDRVHPPLASRAYKCMLISKRPKEEGYPSGDIDSIDISECFKTKNFTGLKDMQNEQIAEMLEVYAYSIFTGKRVEIMQAVNLLRVGLDIGSVISLLKAI